MMQNKLTKLTLLIFVLLCAGMTASAGVEFKTMTIDFEKNAIGDYSADLAYSNFGLGYSVTAHGGSNYGKNTNTSTTSTAYLQIKKKVNPVSLTCFISKPSTNNNAASTWEIQVSEDGSRWITVSSTNAIGMNPSVWQEFTADLSSYFDVYVRICLSGTTQVRYIDDLTLTLKDFTADISSACTDGTKYYGTLSVPFAFTVPEGVTVSEIGVTNNELVVEDYAANAVVPASTGVMISSSTAGVKDFAAATGGTSVLGDDNRLRPTLSGITAENMAAADASCLYYRLTMHNGVTIGYWWGAENGAAFSMGANKAYLAVPNSSVRQGFSLFGDNELAIDEKTMMNAKADNRYYNLQGQLLAKPTKGLYIVNGKKAFNR